MFSMLLALASIVGLQVIPVCSAATSLIKETKASKSPIQDCQSGSACITVYNDAPKMLNERVGKKLALRSLYMMPVYNISKRICGGNTSRCSDFYESAFIYLEVQSIWPEPILLTAARVAVKSRTKSIHRSVGAHGVSALESQITANAEPGTFLFRPGEIKLILLSQGFKLNGILDFFKGDILDDIVWSDITPAVTPNTDRVQEFNRFLAQRYGENTKFRIELFEKDYQSVLTTEVGLTQGGTLFSRGDVQNNLYQFRHDAFIGEVLYQLHGGTDAFEYRVRKTYADNRSATQ